jgi:hypothetical protein
MIPEAIRLRRLSRRGHGNIDGSAAPVLLSVRKFVNDIELEVRGL